MAKRAGIHPHRRLEKPGLRPGAHTKAPRRPGVPSTYKPRSPAMTSKIMAAIRSSENAAEVSLRRTLFRMGMRYRKYDAEVPGQPDIVFPSAKVAVFVDGDYWHARVLREEGIEALRRTLKTANRSYWEAKFQRRVAKDDAVNAELKRSGWRVLRFWESDVKKDLLGLAEAVKRFVRSGALCAGQEASAKYGQGARRSR